MINLLPTEHKQSILYARRNSNIVRWLLGIAVALAGIGIITGGSLFYLKQDSDTIQTSIDKTKNLLKEQKETETLARVEQMSGNLKLATEVLSNEVLFSKLLGSIGEVMPPGTALQSLSLTNNIASTGINLEVVAVSYEAGSRAHVNLNNPENGIFSRSDLLNITCLPENDDSRYPCTVSIRALFKEKNQFLLINKGGQS